MLLMIPGPIEFDPAVLRAMSRPTLSHMSTEFAAIFGEAFHILRDVLLSRTGQPFVMAGSGTLAMDMAAANLIEPGDKALALSTGYFSDRMVEILERYEAQVRRVSAEVGVLPSLEEVERVLSEGGYKLVTVTQVDTSTGMLCDVKALARPAWWMASGPPLGRRCGRRSGGVDVYFTASQKAIGVPPGLAILVASERAMEAFRRRTTPVRSYYADFTKWLPIMQAYERKEVAYFGTPAVNLIYALLESLGQILEEGMEARFRRHRLLGRAFQAGIQAMGLGMVPRHPGGHREGTPGFGV